MLQATASYGHGGHCLFLLQCSQARALAWMWLALGCGSRRCSRGRRERIDNTSASRLVDAVVDDTDTQPLLCHLPVAAVGSSWFDASARRGAVRRQRPQPALSRRGVIALPALLGAPLAVGAVSASATDRVHFAGRTEQRRGQHAILQGLQRKSPKPAAVSTCQLEENVPGWLVRNLSW